MARLRIDAVSKRYGEAEVVSGVSLDVADGEFLVLLGPSGCGKSTLLRLVAGLETPTSGRVLLDDNDITETAPQRRDLAMVFQSYALYPHLTVERNIAFPLRARRHSRAEIADRVARAADALDLTPLLRRRPAQLSGGQRQRVALARAMVREPGAFLMDEPLSNLDAKLRGATRAGLIDLHDRLGATFLYVTHDQVEAMTMANRIALLDAGRLAQIGSPTELYDRPRSTFVAGFLGAPPMNLLAATVVERDGELRAVADGFDAALGITGAQRARTVTVGVRPERLRLVAAGALRGRVTLVENLGSEELLHVDLGGGRRICARAPRPAGPRAGDLVQLDAEPADLHLFDPGSGLRLEWIDTESPALSVA
ncbi:ABC transporter ATP-binding protein [Nocardia puris]|uniref:Trehalose import ATP-binding protein SugC n=1 Tax=Nocardia puris TaxID=208602 RepID=A0A366E1A9_9NOCA|nr:ABC transporter ATP-binding protein [Nocardia puris]MBF6209578.1 ABC transporter ATP-binding protein [Nocardia puris]MBF6366150.1 ABC transporter ATP-binding protein [Nocardia puris]MBF6458511.1 ABC transporter ATP-binding protein [Nocardia puris]RBO96156.1 carbohydrate ABC transporter ATP-binding protein (CUT1 family) [Nocardia puris]